MLAQLLFGGIAGAVVAIVISLIAYRIYRRNLVNTLIQQQGWENAQEKRQQDWERKQEKLVATLEERLSGEVQQVQHEWDAWEQKDIARVQMLEQQYEFATAQSSLEQILEHLPLVEEASLPETENQSRRNAAAKARSAQLAGEDLSGRNLARRYLRHANLRGASLVNANLFMADLSYACLVGADLTHADLSGANLVGADLSNAVLTNANLLVADVNKAIFAGAAIAKARNLVLPHQTKVDTTGRESEAVLDEDEDVTQTRLPIIPKAAITTPAAAPDSPPVEHTASERAQELSIEETPTGDYDIIRAQSLEAIPEPEAVTESGQQPSILSFPGILPETPFLSLDNEEESLSLSDEALRMLEEVHFSSHTHHSTDDFDATDSHKTYTGRRVRAS